MVKDKMDWKFQKKIQNLHIMKQNIVWTLKNLHEICEKKINNTIKTNENNINMIKIYKQQ